ncbi:Hypothetical protein LUCI_1165 [Lucifera butyrica]|uniref:Uncharacterized protein n=1 Tax=Lucifera butyrica TaxID=1351585 RepID=A0A498R3H4_9FIRM|nr:hypothetical protein [Lucifera butyrica]VBB05954.1 Hypothetical protein LUCI_1165 [Lucifera butyrica]
MHALWDSISNGLVLAKPFLGAIILIAALVFIGDKGSKISLNRNSPCLAALCIFTFALGSGLTAWFLLMKPAFALFGVTFALTYPLVSMYWSFWLLASVLVAAKKLVYDSVRRPRQLQ